MTPRELHLVLPARPENVLVVRQALAGLADALELPSQRIDDMKTVVTEACNNVVLHAYDDDEEGSLEVTAVTSEDEIEIRVEDHGRGFQPSAGVDEPSLGLGLPLIASLSDSFEIAGAAGEGTRMTVRFGVAERASQSTNGAVPLGSAQALALEISPGVAVRPVLARVIGALAARAEFSVERLADTVLLGDAVSAHKADDFSHGRLEISIEDGDGTLDVKVGPLIEGGGDRILAQMDIPGGGGSLRRLASAMEVTQGETDDGDAAEFLVFEVSS